MHRLEGVQGLSNTHSSATQGVGRKGNISSRSHRGGAKVCRQRGRTVGSVWEENIGNHVERRRQVGRQRRGRLVSANSHWHVPRVGKTSHREGTAWKGAARGRTQTRAGDPGSLELARWNPAVQRRRVDLLTRTGRLRGALDLQNHDPQVPGHKCNRHGHPADVDTHRDQRQTDPSALGGWGGTRQCGGEEEHHHRGVEC